MNVSKHQKIYLNASKNKICECLFVTPILGLDQVEVTGNPMTANTIPMVKSRKRKRNFASHYPLTANYELMELRKKKLQLECAKLELELEKMPLECAKLELEIQKLQRDLLTPEDIAPDHQTSQLHQH